VGIAKVLIDPLIDISSSPAITEIPELQWLRETTGLLPLVDR
jgi:hypothetical protein